eukprot:8267002-Karenia_brevis.AAC.1
MVFGHHETESRRGCRRRRCRRGRRRRHYMLCYVYYEKSEVSAWGHANSAYTTMVMVMVMVMMMMVM